MTREEAIKRLKSDIYEYADFTENPNENEFWMAFDMAIKALEKTDVSDTNVGDLISRQAVRIALLNKGQHSERYKLGETWELNLMEIEEALEELPSVEPERKTGKWIGEERWCLPKCSVCGASCFGEHGFDAIKTPYCPSCGAKMEVDDAE